MSTDKPNNPPTRREFIEYAGVAIASTILSGSIAGAQEAADPTGTSDESHIWSRARQCWLDLPELTVPETETWSFEQANAELARRQALHRGALDELVATGDLTAPVAAQMQLAFTEASFHTWRNSSGWSCYEPPFPAEQVRMTSRHDLVSQTSALEEMARQSALDEETVATARLAIERDIYVLSVLPELDRISDYQAQEDATTPLMALFDQTEIETTPEGLEAARILCQLLLGVTP